MDWYYADAGRQIGPIDDNAFRQAVGQGSIRAETLVWHSGLANWMPYRTLAAEQLPPAPNIYQAPSPAYAPFNPGLNPALNPNDNRFCAECGNSYPASEMAAFGAAMVCANCKPVYAQKLREGVLSPSRYIYGGFWIRFGAVLIDGIVLWILSLIPTALIMGAVGMANINAQNVSSLLWAEGVLILLNLAVSFSYETFFLSKFGATPGKMACSLKVINADGSPLTFGKAAARYGAKIVSSFTFGIGYIMAGFDEEKRALHDRIVDTRVVRK
jgi:uncharacterized RDD family membrane protein YckC